MSAKKTPSVPANKFLTRKPLPTCVLSQLPTLHYQHRTTYMLVIMHYNKAWVYQCSLLIFYIKQKPCIQMCWIVWYCFVVIYVPKDVRTFLPQLFAGQLLMKSCDLSLSRTAFQTWVRTNLLLSGTYAFLSLIMQNLLETFIKKA